jgi:hypothetical protein
MLPDEIVCAEDTGRTGERLTVGRVDEDVNQKMVPEVGKQLDAIAGDARADRWQGCEPGDSLHA